jgi:hypothetical protein
LQVQFHLPQIQHHRTLTSGVHFISVTRKPHARPHNIPACLAVDSDYQRRAAAWKCGSPLPTNDDRDASHNRTADSRNQQRQSVIGQHDIRQCRRTSTNLSRTRCWQPVRQLTKRISTRAASTMHASVERAPNDTRRAARILDVGTNCRRTVNA